MGYILYAFLGKKEAVLPIKQTYSCAQLCDLHEEISIIPMTEELFDEINENQVSPGIQNFALMTTSVEDKIVALVGKNTVAYIEAEYHGGYGGQSGLLWTNKERVYLQMFSTGVINEILRRMGMKAKNKWDEFDTVGLGNHRNTEDWIKQTKHLPPNSQ